MHIVTGVAETRAAALALTERYSDRHSSDRVFDLSWTHSQVVLQQLAITEAESQLYEQMAGRVLYSDSTLRASASVLSRNRRGQSSLWAYGISGDLPIVLLRVTDQANFALVRQVIKAHAYWRLKGLIADLVVWNEDTSVYRQTLHEEIMSTLGSADFVDRPGGDLRPPCADQPGRGGGDRILMQAVARLLVVETATGRSSEQS